MSLPGILLGAALTTDADRSYIPRGILFSSIFWLSAGALIGAFLKDRLRAIIVWAALTAITNVAAVIGWSVLIALAPD